MRPSECSAIADLPHPFLLVRDDDLSSEVMMEGPLLCIGGVINGAVLRTAKEPGPVSVVVQLRDSVSELGEFGDEWDAIEEGTVRLSGRNPRVQGLTGEIIIDLESLEPGTYRIRVGAAHRLRADSARVRIELAETETDTPTSTLRDTDGLRCETAYTENYPIFPEDQPDVSKTVSTATVSGTWQRITDWRGHHAPDVLAALADPASQQDVDAVESLFPCPWPDDLRNFYRLHNGFRPGDWAQILPEHDLLSLDGVRTLQEEHLALTHELAHEDPDIAQFITERQPEQRDAGLLPGCTSNRLCLSLNATATYSCATPEPVRCADVLPSVAATPPMTPVQCGRRWRSCSPNSRMHSNLGLCFGVAGDLTPCKQR
jgi:hypothetical protein